MKIKLKCINCQNDFDAEYKHRNKKFCGRKCYFEYANKNKIIGRPRDGNIREVRKCIICNNEFEVKKINKKKLCSDECRKKWNAIPVNNNNRLKSGKKALMDKYGVDSVFKTEIFRKKGIKTLLSRYGVDNPMKSDIIVNNLKLTLKNDQLYKLLPKLKLHNLELLDEYTVNKDKNTSMTYNFKCLKCNNIFSSTVLGSGKIPICRKCFPMTKNSKLEESIRDFLNDNKIKHIDNKRKLLNGQEIDLLIEYKKLAIEINGNYFHSELAGGKDRNYHLEKSKLAHNMGFKLVHIFEDELLYKKNIVLSRLSNLLCINTNKIYARKCAIKEVSKKDSSEFLNKNHIQGVSIDKIRIGLYYENELVSIITFGPLRRIMGGIPLKDNFELLRFASKLNTIVVGGFSKLLNYFINEYSPKKILTYADIRWSGLNTIGNLYTKNGFKYVGNTPPNYWYVKINEYNNRYHRFNFRKDILIKEGYDPKLTELEIMRMKNYDRIWDCGHMKFEYVV